MYRIMRIFATLLLVSTLALLTSCETASKPDNRPRQVDYDLSGYFSSLPRDFPEARKYHASDGSQLTFDGYRHGRKNPVALIYLHGLEGHAGWGRELAVRLADRNYDVFALDRRGSGRSKGNVRTITGQPPGFEDLVSDVQAFLKPLKGHYESVYLIGYDWGARLAVAYGIAYQGEASGFVLISPRLFNDKPKVFDASLLVTDPDLQRQLSEDPLRLAQVDEQFSKQGGRMAGFVKRYIKRLNRPVQLFLAGDDSLVDRDKVIRLLEKAGTPSLDVQIVTGARHALPLASTDRLARDIDHWVRYQEMSRRAK